MKILLIGHPVAHSISPAIHNAALRELRLPASYSALDVLAEQVPAAVAGLRDAEVLGGNVTVPHKQAVMPHLDELSPDARRIGAVNTIVNQSGRLVGHNTDANGFLASLREVGVELVGRRVLLLGAGGAARAIAFAVLGSGAAELWILNRDEGRAHALAEDARRQRLELGEIQAGGLSPEQLESCLRRCDLVVNSTTVGMHGAESLLSGHPIPAHSIVCDIIYNPPETELLRLARRAGARTLNGLGMLVHQAALALTIWTGRPAPLTTMYEAARAALVKKTETG